MNATSITLILIGIGLAIAAAAMWWPARREEDPGAALATSEPDVTIGESVFVERQLEALKPEIDEVADRFMRGDYSDLDDKGREILAREPDPDTDERRLEGANAARTANAWTEPATASNKNPPCPGGHPSPEALAIAKAANEQIARTEAERDKFAAELRFARTALPYAPGPHTDLATAIRDYGERTRRELADQQREINELRNAVDQAHLYLDRARITRRVRAGQRGVYRMLFLYERIQRLRQRKAR